MFTIFTKLCGADAALEIIALRSGSKPSAEAVRQWKRRGKIPGNHAAILIEECYRRGIPASLDADCRATYVPQKAGRPRLRYVLKDQNNVYSD